MGGGGGPRWGRDLKFGEAMVTSNEFEIGLVVITKSVYTTFRRVCVHPYLCCYG